MVCEHKHFNIGIYVFANYFSIGKPSQGNQERYAFSFVDMDTNPWDFENEYLLSIAKMKQPLKKG